MKTYASITVIGRDKSGVIAKVTSFLFAQQANIEGLEEKVTRGQFGMTIQASWAARHCSAAKIRTGLSRLSRELGMEIKIRFSEPSRRQRFALLVTRETHCFESVLAAVKKRQLAADPVVVLCNHPDFAPLARKHKLPFVHVPWQDRVRAEQRTLRLLEQHDVDFVVLARFMKILSPTFVWHYKNKILNIHPSLLPSFPGPSAYRQAYEHGVKIVGVTAHFVSMHLDEGPIIAQSSFPVRAGMTLAEIIAAGQAEESRVLVKAIKLFLTKRLDVYWGMVKAV